MPDPQNVRFEDVDRVLKEAIANAPPRLTPCPKHPGGVHLWLPATACELLRHKWPANEIAAYLVEHSQDCGRPWYPTARSKALSITPSGKSTTRLRISNGRVTPTTANPSTSRTKLKRVADRLGDALRPVRDPGEPLEVHAVESVAGRDSPQAFARRGSEPSSLMSSSRKAKPYGCIRASQVTFQRSITSRLVTRTYGFFRILSLGNIIGIRGREQRFTSQRGIGYSVSFGTHRERQSAKGLWLRALVPDAVTDRLRH